MSLEYVWSHPLGIPFIVPGELIDDCTIAFLKQSAGAGIALKSTKAEYRRKYTARPPLTPAILVFYFEYWFNIFMSLRRVRRACEVQFIP